MEFIVKDQDGNEAGPFQRQEIEQYILDGRLTPATMIRNSMIKKWNTIEDMRIFTESVKQYQDNHLQPEKLRLADTPRSNTSVNISQTSFKNTVTPVPAGFILRSLAASIDWLIIAAIAVAAAFGAYTLIYAQADTPDKPATAKETKKEKVEATDKTPAQPLVAAKPQFKTDADSVPTTADNLSAGYAFGSLWQMRSSLERYSCISSSQNHAVWVRSELIGKYMRYVFALTSLLGLLYFSLFLGLRAQTPGMWFWGIFIEKADGEEAFMFRCLCFALLILPLGFLSLFSILSRGRAVHDLICGVKVVKISGQRS